MGEPEDRSMSPRQVMVGFFVPFLPQILGVQQLHPPVIGVVGQSDEIRPFVRPILDPGGGGEFR